MVACGEGGASMRLLGLLGLRCGKTLGGSGGFSLDSSSLRWEMGLRSSSSMICGVDTNH